MISCNEIFLQGLDAFYKLKSDAELVNEIFGFQFLTSYLENITYLCQIPDIFLVPYASFSYGLLVTYTMFNTATWIIAAKFHSHVRKSLKKWCQICKRHICKEDYSKLLFVKLEMNSEQIAMSCEFFDISYRFLASVRK